jgi:hypothetical protein
VRERLVVRGNGVGETVDGARPFIGARGIGQAVAGR